LKGHKFSNLVSLPKVFEGTQVFLRKTFGKVPENLNLVSFQKMVDKKKLFEGRATTQTKNAKFVSFQKMVDKKKAF